jgi:hypothetical protein
MRQSLNAFPQGLRAANTCGSINNSRHFEHVFIGNLLLERELVVPANANPRLGFGLIMASGSVNFVAPLKIQSNLVIIAGGAIEISSIESVGLGTLNVFLVSATDEIKVSLSSGALRINAITPARINIPVNVGVNLNYRPLPLFSRTALAIIR